MPKDYFQFKQFRIRQDQCAMKVCTDSCLFGAVVDVAEAGTILDIGTGTGLLALMAAQRSGADITALEIDADAAAQARENVAASPWASRIRVLPESLQDFALKNEKLFEVILCNPPFYPASLKSPDAARNVAMHSQDLSFGEIIRFVVKFLEPGGCLYMLLPPAESRQFEDLIRMAGLFPQARLEVFTGTEGRHIRSIQTYRFAQPAEVAVSRLSIRNADHSYTPEFQELLRDYYLIF